ncbi:MAG: hypothetical protein ABI945_07940, partial [Nitrospirales bacterium]
KGAIAAGVPSDQQYLLNHRTYFTVIHPIWADFYSGFEWQHVWSEWSTNEKFQGDKLYVVLLVQLLIRMLKMVPNCVLASDKSST